VNLIASVEPLEQGQLAELIHIGLVCDALMDAL
jgi:hypothetical protein